MQFPERNSLATRQTGFGRSPDAATNSVSQTQMDLNRRMKDEFTRSISPEPRAQLIRSFHFESLANKHFACSPGSLTFPN